jgi:hypothetical protein
MVRRSNVSFPLLQQGESCALPQVAQDAACVQGSFILKAVCSNPRHKREESFAAVRPWAERVALSVNLKYILQVYDGLE